jgi:signal transduction histidine kinase
MGNWIRAQWRDYLDSSDPEVAASGSTPGFTLAVVVTLIGIFLGLAYLPGVREAAGFENVWVAVGLTLLAGSLTYAAWRHRCRGTIGSIATLLDNTFYSQALAFAAMNTRDSVSVALAIIHALVLVTFPGQGYAFNFLLAVAMALPVGVMTLVFQPALPIALITNCGMVAMLMFTVTTRNRREFARRQRSLEDALGAADRVAEESVQAALTSTLLTLGHFLHELSNYQTAISTNLDYIKVKARLAPEVARALQDAQTAQQEQEALLRKTICDLRSRARPEQGSFQLFDALSSVTTQIKGVETSLTSPTFEFEVTGNPEHLRVVLLNLIRNAEQADARNVRLDVTLEANGHATQIMVHNDGAPLPETAQHDLFKSFATSAKPGGNGLGLYLVKRYVELLGGRISVRTGPMGGAAFVMLLPGRTARDSTSTRSAVVRNILEKSA